MCMIITNKQPPKILDKKIGSFIKKKGKKKQ